MAQNYQNLVQHTGRHLAPSQQQSVPYNPETEGKKYVSIDYLAQQLGLPFHIVHSRFYEGVPTLLALGIIEKLPDKIVSSRRFVYSPNKERQLLKALKQTRLTRVKSITAAAPPKYLGTDAETLEERVV